MKKRRTHLKKTIRLFLEILFYITLSIISIIVILNSLDIKLSGTSMTYTEKSNIDYKVYLTDKSYFEGDYLNSGGQYISKIIKEINSKFKYSYSSTNKFNLKYKYKITATIDVAQKQDNSINKQILNKKYVLLDEKEVTKDNANQFTINENVNVDYQMFRNYVNEFSRKYALSLDSVLKIKMYVDITGNKDGYKKEFKDSNVVELDVPLSGQTIEITPNNINNNKSNNFDWNDKNSLIKKLDMFIMGIVFFFVTVIMFVLKLIELINISYKQTEYIRTINKLLKVYDDIIVNSSEPVNLEGLTIINVSTFKELIDAEAELRIPIIYYETKFNRESQFVIINNNQAWIYTYVNNYIKRKQ